MKKILALLLCVLMLLTLAACGKDTTSSNLDSSSQASTDETTSDTVAVSSQEDVNTDADSSTQTTSEEKPATSSTGHTHSYSDATCTKAAKCSCGAKKGKALGHSYKNGVCTRCKAKDPNYKAPTSSATEKTVTPSLDKLQGNLYISERRDFIFEDLVAYSIDFSQVFSEDVTANIYQTNYNEGSKNDDSVVVITHGGKKYYRYLEDGGRSAYLEGCSFTIVGKEIHIGSDPYLKLVLLENGDLKVTYVNTSAVSGMTWEKFKVGDILSTKNR